MTWGVEDHVIERFTKAGVAKEKISFSKDTFRFSSPDQNPTQVIETFRQFSGPTMNAYEAAEKNGKVEDLHSQLVELAKAHNTSTNGGTLIAATFFYA